MNDFIILLTCFFVIVFLPLVIILVIKWVLKLFGVDMNVLFYDEYYDCSKPFDFPDVKIFTAPGLNWLLLITAILVLVSMGCDLMWEKTKKIFKK